MTSFNFSDWSSNTHTHKIIARLLSCKSLLYQQQLPLIEFSILFTWKNHRKEESPKAYQIYFEAVLHNSKQIRVKSSTENTSKYYSCNQPTIPQLLILLHALAHDIFCHMPTDFLSTYILPITVTAKNMTWTLFLTHHGSLPRVLESTWKCASFSVFPSLKQG